jgi:putative DNA primase/helicase
VLPAAPLLAVTAPTPGTGKTLIAETFAIIATGRRASVLSLGHDDAEAEKRLAGVLLAGDAVIALDNIERPLKGDLLCQVATQQFVRLRPLGASGMLSIPTHALMVATGNNLSIVGDLKRRVVLIRMDSGEEKPEERSFSHDHLEDVFARRGELIRAALTLPLAYLAAGAPAITIKGKVMHPLGGFEHWDRMVRRPLAWLGLADPLKASESLREQDPDLEGMRLLLGAWRDVFPNEPKTAAELVNAGQAYKALSQIYEYPELRDALQLVCNEKPNARRLGYWLRRHQNRIVDGMQVKQATMDRLNVARWQILDCR